mgnify:CR=1 FL=1
MLDGSKPIISENAVYSRQEAAEILGVSLSTLKKLIDEKRIGAAEDLLFEYLAAEIPGGLALAVGFYEWLNALADGELRLGGFSRAEISLGLRDAALKCGIDPSALSGGCG